MIPRVRDVAFLVQVFARVVGAGYVVGVVEAHSSCRECAADNVGRCVLGGQGLLPGCGVCGCGRGGGG